jgi:outer membrane receptor protein involved in Fe transport|tara:strand:+ start:1451 stop:3727 length:2277 start_codon:yes stop_codon:yes gene_type:complete
MSQYNYKAVAAIVLLMILPVSVWAQILEEIIVTAQKREQSLQDVPISVSAVSGETIENRSINSLSDLSRSVPNLYITENQIDSTIQVRGIRTGANKGFEQSVAMYMDGIYYGRSQLIRLPLMDLDRVEVLRGPQPTLFGKNAVAGAVSVASARPTDQFEGSITASYEFEHEESHITGMLSGPLSDTVRGRLVASVRDMDEGYFTNQISGKGEPSVEDTFLRGTLEWDASDDLLVRIKAEYAEFDREGWPLELHSPQGAFSAIYQGPFFVETNEDYRSETSRSNSLNEVTNVVLNLEYTMGDHTLTSITGYVDYETTEIVDVDYARLDLLDGTNQGEEYEQFSQEIRLTSPGGEKVDYIVGLYYHNSDLTVTDEVFFGSTFLLSPFAPLADSNTDRLYTQDATLWSVFAQADINFTDALTLTLGARYNQEDKEGRRQLTLVPGATNIGINIPSPVPVYTTLLDLLYGALNMYPHDISADRDEDSFNPLVNLQYQINDNIMTYVSYSQGTKAGGFDIRGNSVQGHPVAVPGTFEFEDEQATNYELGAKMSFERSELNLAVYYTNYEDLQVQIFDGTLNFLVTNAAEATTKGIEADGRYALTDNLTLYGSVAFLDFEYDKFENGTCAWPLTGVCSLTGKRAVVTPDWRGNFGIDFEHEFANSLLLDANLNLDYSDSYLLMGNQDPNSKQDSYTTVGLVVGLGSSDGKWRVSLIGDNLTDERIYLTLGAMPLSTTFTGGTGIAYDSFYLRPRNYSLKLEYNF